MSSVHAASVLVLFLLLHLSDSRHIDNAHITNSRSSHVKDQNLISGSTSKEPPVSVSRFVPGAVKHRHRRPPLFFADYPKPSTRPPRHN
ncbi:unnamed protein product [Arabis nemorensis]|uniref:Uncharacterized protein n=1 Tax=Arabis nemorensis TaxID=586526 RepID=A0A565CPR6_9BRAS|nr:unnamed protein product [Arabis nemorensis]